MVDSKVSYYHIYNHANGDELLFTVSANYYYFLSLIRRFLEPSIKLYAYCLLPNHFHLLISFGHDQEKFSFHQFSKLFNSYSKSYNTFNNRKGSLFQKNFKRRKLESMEEIKAAILYIHRNPIHHGFTGQYNTWEYCSYNFLKNQEGYPKYSLALPEVLSFFGSRESFLLAHEDYKQ